MTMRILVAGMVACLGINWTQPSQLPQWLGLGATACAHRLDRMELSIKQYLANASATLDTTPAEVASGLVHLDQLQDEPSLESHPDSGLICAGTLPEPAPHLAIITLAPQAIPPANPSPAPEPPALVPAAPNPDVDARFSAIVQDMAAAFTTPDPVPQLAATPPPPPPPAPEIAPAPAVEAATLACPTTPNPAPAPDEVTTAQATWDPPAFSPLDPPQDLYPGLAHELNLTAQGWSDPTLPSQPTLANAAPAPNPSSTRRVISALRLTGQAIRAWLDILQNDARGSVTTARLGDE